MRRALAGIALVLALAPGASAAPPEPAAAGRVAAVIDGDTVRLAAGPEVRLVGIQAPKLPLGRAGFRAWPLAEEARAALVALVDGRDVALVYGGRKVDRHGRLLAHLHLDRADGRWVQGAMIETGMARVYTFADNTARAARMLALERAARAARRGIWAHPFYAVRRPEAADADIGTFQLVEGRVEAAEIVRGRMFLNFGSDWRTDFTVHVAPRDLGRFAGAGLGPESYRGRRVRVRGWLRRWNGPLIDATHPEQIEILDR